MLAASPFDFIPNKIDNDELASFVGLPIRKECVGNAERCIQGRWPLSLQMIKLEHWCYKLVF